MARATEPASEPATVTVELAEGVVQVPPSAGRPPAPPTQEDYDREWKQYRATTNIPHGAVIAISEGAPVPAGHPLRKQWQRDEMVEYVGDQHGFGAEQDPPGDPE